MTTMNQAPDEILKPLFEKAKSVDEFEFGCCLLRIRGIEGPGWNPWLESRKLLQQILSLLQAPVEHDLKLRLLLFAYCHATEMDDPYDFVVNLLSVSLGMRCSITPLASVTKSGSKAVVYPHTKVARIVDLAKDADFPDVGSGFDQMFVKKRA